MKIFRVVCLLLFPSWLTAQGCADGRYVDELFGVDITRNVTYGENTNFLGFDQSLEMDIYEPEGDTAALRPLIVWEHGGSFVAGDKAGPDITSLAEPFARRGYVNASAEYRLGIQGIPFPGPDQQTASEAVFRAVADFKAAVRWWYKSARTGNPYRIDTNRIFVGGVSAGGVAAVHLAYVDQESELPSVIDTTKAGLGGGIEGLSGNPGYPTRVAGVINVCGMISDTNYMEPGDVPIVSLHGTSDDVVPYGYDEIVLAFWPIMFVHGSGSVHARAAHLGLDECLFTHGGAGHTPHIGSPAYTDTTIQVIQNFLLGKVCSGAASQCGYLATEQVAAVEDLASVTVYPNPAREELFIEATTSDSWRWSVYDGRGQLVSQGAGLRGGVTVEVDAWARGMYYLWVVMDKGSIARKLILE